MSEIKSPGLVGSHSLVPVPVSACSLALDKSFFFFFGGGGLPRVMWDLSYPTRDQAWAPCSENSRVLTTEPPGKSLGKSFL